MSEENKETNGYIRVDFKAPLEGYWVMADPEEVTWGFFADIESGQQSKIIEACASVLKGGKLPKSTKDDPVGTPVLRLLKQKEIEPFVSGLAEALTGPKEN